MVLMIFGTLMIACGFASVIYGNFMNNDFSSQLAHYSSGGDPGNIWMILGVIAIFSGIVMVIDGSKQMKAEKQPEARRIPTRRMIFFCIKCKSTYGAASGAINFCPDCTIPLIETQITCDYWHSLSDDQKELERKKFIQGTYSQEKK